MDRPRQFIKAETETMISRTIMTAAAAAFFTLAAPGANAATVMGSDITDGSMLGADVHYQVGGASAGTTSYGGSYWNIAGQGSVYQLCAEIFDSSDIAPFYTVTSGITAFGDMRDAQLTALLSNAFPLLDSAVSAYIAANGSLVHSASLSSEWNAIGSYSSALQALTWIIAENASATISPLDTNAAVGIINDGSADPAATGHILDWANNINSGAWQANDQVTIHYAASSDSRTQDRVWMEMNSAVPEPGTWAMLLTGFGVVGLSLRRRPRAAQFA